MRQDGGPVGGGLLTPRLNRLVDVLEVGLSPSLGHSLFQLNLDGHQVFFKSKVLHFQRFLLWW